MVTDVPPAPDANGTACGDEIAQRALRRALRDPRGLRPALRGPRGAVAEEAGDAGRVVLVPGGAGGLGAAITALLLQEGALPVVGYRSNRGRALVFQQKLQDLYGGPVTLVEGDVRDPAALAQYLATHDVTALIVELPREQTCSLRSIGPIVARERKVYFYRAYRQCDEVDEAETRYQDELWARDIRHLLGDPGRH